jgi:hypothetical protein
MDRVEELPVEALAPDLMRRAFRDLFESGLAGTPPSAPEIAIINLSVGDPAAPFDTVLSSWARTIDWLSYYYGVLVVVSAGNYTTLNLSPSNSAELTALTGEERRQSTLGALDRQQNQRRLIAPAESINALTVGAIHDDAAQGAPIGYRVDPNDGLVSVSPVSATGSGYRRSLKPDLAAPGGRAYFASGPPTTDLINFRPASAAGPGIKVASPRASRETYTIGTSVAAALVSRQAARLYDVIDSITDSTPITRRQRASAIKALLVHGVGDFEDLQTSPLPLERAIGNGILLRDFSSGCATNEATGTCATTTASAWRTCSATGATTWQARKDSAGPCDLAPRQESLTVTASAMMTRSGRSTGCRPQTTLTVSWPALISCGSAPPAGARPPGLAGTGPCSAAWDPTASRPPPGPSTTCPTSRRRRPPPSPWPTPPVSTRQNSGSTHCARWPSGSTPPEVSSTAVNASRRSSGRSSILTATGSQTRCGSCGA